MSHKPNCPAYGNYQPPYEDCTCGADDLCVNCKKYPATMDWAGTMSAFEVARGARTKRWCDMCATEAQLTYAKAQARRIPELESRLTHLRTSGKGVVK